MPPMITMLNEATESFSPSAAEGQQRRHQRAGGAHASGADAKATA